MIKRFADIVFKWYCRNDYYSDIRGDLEENYLRHRERHSLRISDLLYLREILLLFRPSIIGFNYSSNKSAMFFNYLKIAFRNLKKQKSYTSINVLGLSTGIVSLFFILIFIESEFSYDVHHQEIDRFYRVETDLVLNGEPLKFSTTSPGMRERILEKMPEVEVATRIVGFLGISQNILRVDDRSFTESEGFLADPNFFELFSYPITYGDPSSMLTNPQSIALSQTLSEKMFDEKDPVGEVISIINDYGSSDYTITGVYDNEEVNSHMNPAFVCSMNSGAIGKYVVGNDRLVGNYFLFTYVRLRPDTDPIAAGKKIQSSIAEHVEKAENSHTFEPVRDIYLYSQSQNESGIGGDIRYIYIMITIAIMILSIACINFANMATAQASKRAKEIGVRKTFGAERRMIIAQFLGEATVITSVALIVSLVAILLVAPSYSSFTGKEVSPTMIWEKSGLLLAIGFFTSILAGSYPSFYLASLKVMRILAGQTTGSSGSSLVRKGLVVFQFVVGVLLIVGSMTTIRQLDFIQSKPLGFTATNQLVIPLQSSEVISELEKVKTAFSQVPGVKKVAGVSYTPAQYVLSDNRYKTTPTNADKEGVVIRQNDVDFQLIETLGIEVLAGRTFDRNMVGDLESAVVLNEAAVQTLGKTNSEIVNQQIYTEEGGEIISYKVIGVVADFHSQSLHRPISPYLFAMRASRDVSSVIVTIDSDGYQAIIEGIEAQWDGLFPTLSFEFHFLDEQLKALYQKDRKFAQIIVLFTAVALILCLIGIFGLTSFTVQQSLKEISIRKVLGASIRNIYTSFAIKFLLLVAIAALISIPTGIVVMNKWLELFAYHIEPGLTTVVIPIFLIVGATLAVISYKIFFAARVNPSVILRGD